jgi:hypothetical protein
MDKPTSDNNITALIPRDTDGHQFVCYADCCSGIPDTEHERTFAKVNAVLRRLHPQPEFICFPGDEIRGLTLDAEKLRQQWRYWQQKEMGWLDREVIPLYHTTGNHTAYNAVSQQVFREMLDYHPRNGPPGQEGLSYFIRRENLILVFVNTLNDQLGGEGHVETEWLDQVLTAHNDTKHKLVFGHHPVFPINGYSGPYQRQLGDSCGRVLWDILKRHKVAAYFCSHILAFDVQVHHGILQILTAGAGTSPLMPADLEFHHLVQAAIDSKGLRYQVLDTSGNIREGLEWPLKLPPFDAWDQLTHSQQNAPYQDSDLVPLIVWRFKGRCCSQDKGSAQTLLSSWDEGDSPPLIWIGLRGRHPRAAVLLRHSPGRSPHLWLGPVLTPESPFDFQIALHPDMGPGGVLWRTGTDGLWTSMEAASPWGPERLSWPARWSKGYERDDPHCQPFRGTDLQVWYYKV